MNLLYAFVAILLITFVSDFTVLEMFLEIVGMICESVISVFALNKMHEQIMRQVDAKAFNTIKVVVEEVLLECAPVNVLAVAFMKLFVVSGQALHEEWHYTMQHWSSETTGVEFFVGLGVLGAVMLSLSLNIGEDVLFDDRGRVCLPSRNTKLGTRDETHPDAGDAVRHFAPKRRRCPLWPCVRLLVC